MGGGSIRGSCVPIFSSLPFSTRTSSFETALPAVLPFRNLLCVWSLGAEDLGGADGAGRHFALVDAGLGNVFGGVETQRGVPMQDPRQSLGAESNWPPSFELRASLNCCTVCRLCYLLHALPSMSQLFSSLRLQAARQRIECAPGTEAPRGAVVG